jgi:cytochrome o ubiquinol oxidase subunit II
MRKLVIDVVIIGRWRGQQGRIVTEQKLDRRAEAKLKSPRCTRGDRVSARPARRALRLLARSATGLILPLLCTGVAANDGFINPAGPVAAALRDHLIFIVVVMMVVIVPLLIALPWALWRYRIGNKSANYQPSWEFSWPLELLVWGLPLVLVIVLGWKLSEQSHLLDPYRPLAAAEAPLEVQVVGLDWKWVFVYPGQGVAAANELVFVAGRPLRLRLTSGTVMQSFIVPRLGGQIYAMAGMVTELNLMAPQPGEFRGENTQYNGFGFAEQKFLARAINPADFDAWVAKVRQSNPPLNDAAWAALRKPSVLPSPQFFGSIPDRMFAQFVASFAGSPHHR